MQRSIASFFKQPAGEPAAKRPRVDDPATPAPSGSAGSAEQTPPPLPKEPEVKAEIKSEPAKANAEIKAEPAEAKDEIKAEPAKDKAEIKAEPAKDKAEIKAEPAKVKAEIKAEPAAVKPMAEATWPTGEELKDSKFQPTGNFQGSGPVNFLPVAEAFAAIEALKGSGKGSKKAQTTVLTNLYRTVLAANPADLVPTLYLTVNKLAPDYENVEVGIADQFLIRTICEVYGRTEAHIKNALATQEAADLGEVALLSRVSQKMLSKPKPLTVAKVFAEIRSMAEQSGKDSMSKRKAILRKLLVAAQGDEPKYIVRTLQGKLRIGVQKATVLQALAHAFVLSRPSVGAEAFEADIRSRDPAPTDEELEAQLSEMEAAVKQAFCSLPSFDEVAGALQRGVPPAELVTACSIRTGIPVAPMLAKPTKGVTEILDRFQTIAFTAEWKYDGERAQVHISGDKLNVYSRNSENTSGKYPDVVETVRGALAPGVESCILDTEVVAYDPVNKKILPFQTLTTRAKKNVNVDDIQVCVCVYAFDMILLNGESLCALPLAERREKLHASLREVENKLTFAKFRNLEAEDGGDRGEAMEAFLQESIDGSCEGLMLKTLYENSTYEPSKRSLNWLKLKKDYLEGMGDSVDLVVLGGWYGKGKRSGSYGAFLLGVYNPDEEEYQSCCKIGTGFKDEDLKTHYDFFQNHSVEEKPSDYDVDTKLYPDVWFEAVQVWECKAADLQISPIHSAARGAKAEGKGIGLRFPRFLHVRPDKKPEDATRAEQIVEMFEAQSVQQSNVADGDDDDLL